MQAEGKGRNPSTLLSSEKIKKRNASRDESNRVRAFIPDSQKSSSRVKRQVCVLRDTRGLPSPGTGRKYDLPARFVKFEIPTRLQKKASFRHCHHRFPNFFPPGKSLSVIDEGSWCFFYKRIGNERRGGERWFERDRSTIFLPMRSINIPSL